MRSLLTKGLAASTLLLMAVAARAQYPDGRYPDDRQYQDRHGDPGYGRPYGDSRYGAPRYDGRYARGGDSPIARVQADLRYAQWAVYSRSERKRINKAQEELSEFENKWRRGRFDRHELDDSIAAVQHVIDHNGMDERARSMLWNDVEMLRQFRAQFQGRDYYRPY